MSSRRGSASDSARQSSLDRRPQHQRSASAAPSQDRRQPRPTAADTPHNVGRTALTDHPSQSPRQGSQHRRSASARPDLADFNNRLASLKMEPGDFTNLYRNPPARDEVRGPFSRDAFGPVPPGMVGKPYRALQAYVDKSPGQNVDLRVGDEGKVLKTIDDRGQKWLRVSVPARNQEYWVPRACIMVNEAVYYGEIRYDEAMTMEDHVDTARLRKLVPGHSSQFEKAVEAQLIAWSEQKPEVDMGENVKKIISNGTRRNQLIKRIVTGCQKAGSYDMLNSPDFTVSDLDRLEDASTCHKAGIYLSRYSAFNDDASRKPVLRIGKSTQISTRIKAHTEHGDPKSNYNLEKTHYRMAKKARTKIYRVLCHLSNAVDQTIAEQLFNNLLQTWAPEVIKNDGKDINATENLGGSDEGAARLRVARFRPFFLAAYRQKLLSDAVQELTGWPGAVFRANFGASQGLNVSTPLSEEASNESTVWTRFDVPNKLTSFYSHPRKVRVTEKKGKANSYYDLLELGSKATTHRIPFQFMSSKEDLKKADINIEEGTLIYPRFEVRQDGKPHPGSWARLQDLEIWDDHKEATSVAVFFQYQDGDGKWCEFCFRSSTFKEMKEPQQRGTFTRHSQAMGLYRYLMQERLPQNWQEQENWISDYGIARVHQSQFDNYTQTLSWKEVYGPERPRDLPRRRPADKIENELKTAGAQYLSTETGWQGYLPGKLGRGATQKRTACDLCQLIADATGNRTHRCVQSTKINDLCTNCWDAGIPCSWTHNDDLNDQLKALLIFKGSGGKSALPEKLHGLITHKILDQAEDEV